MGKLATLQAQYDDLTARLDAILASNAQESKPAPASAKKTTRKSKAQKEFARLKVANAKAGRAMTTARYACGGCGGYWFVEAKAQAHASKTGHKFAGI